MKKTLKKSLSLLLILSALCSCGCGGSKGGDGTDTQESIETTSETSSPSDTAGQTDAETDKPTEKTDYEQELIALGFPSDYASLLAPIKEKHPNWTFNPINITQLSGGEYTWDYVIAAETEDDENNTVDNGYEDALSYSIDNKSVESGMWYRAKRETIEFFMDARNFLTVKNIFMFENLSVDVGDRTKAVEQLLRNTFMYKTVIPDDEQGRTYAAYFAEVGEELGISPLVIGARLRQEQGVKGDNPLISGKCGTYLYDSYVNGKNDAPSEGYTEDELKKYDGYYNYFNIMATGNGYFEVYLAGMKEAEAGGWTTRAAAIKGGAEKLRDRYINDYQQTLYFQKFNVDARSKRNFWGQYMQGVDAAYDEGYSTYLALLRGKLLGLPFVFDIPVYEGMPESPCPDPGTRYS